MASRSSAPAKLAEYRRKRDFARTAEPSGGPTHASDRGLGFVVQKHAASHLHFDFRLELGGVMKSWAVPKGPSLDPAIKRLAMEVEDHPIEYNTFEGIIPKGQYGGGTVMLWDRGRYEADERGRLTDEEALRRGYEKGQLKFTMHGERLNGSFALIRTRRGESKPQWLLIKHRDAFAAPGTDIVATEVTSIDTGRTMEEIAAGKSAVWQSNRESGGGSRESKRSPAPERAAATRARRPTASARLRRAPARLSRALEPMYASVGTEVPTDDGWVFEPKYDGIRVLAFVTPKSVKLITRNGNDKTAQFPEVADALRKLAGKVRRSLVLDGEIIAVVAGKEGRFQELQSRMHAKQDIEEHAQESPAALIAFDILVDGEDVLLHEPWAVRRGRLEARLRNRTSERIRLSESVPNDGAEMLERARTSGWEGVIAKRLDAPYEPGVRSRSWLKLKIEHRQEFVIGGYTEPRNSREYIGALLLGYFDNGRFIYVGHTGGGFTRQGLKEMYARLRRLERKTSPFEETPKTNEPAHWVRPEVVVEVKFNEWTADRKLRQPIYLGTRDDKDAREVGLERESMQNGAKKKEEEGRAEAGNGSGKKGGPKGKESSGRVRRVRSAAGAAAKKTRRARGRVAATTRESARKTAGSSAGKWASLLSQLERIEHDGGDGTLTFERGKTLKVTSLGRVFFPDAGYTKGDLMRHYVRVAPLILPAMADRPLVLKRFPNGIEGKSFYQQNAPDDAPSAVRVETVTNEQGERQSRLVGGDIATVLYTVQLGNISVDPWHSRVPSLEYADYAILDLDPGPRAPFRRVVQVALAVKAELDALGLHAAPKTSGSTGIHIYVPLPARTTYESSLLVAQLIATRVADAHPRETTVERSVKARLPAAVYVDYLQNIRAKTVAAVYCVRAKPGAMVSTPLRWSELTDRLDPRVFTIEAVPTRVARIGDLWWPAMRRRNSLKGLL